MSMLQLLGGVAVAGAVAAGTTAFTAGGIDVSGTTALAGGTNAITVDGAQLDAATFAVGNTVGTYGRITSLDVTLSGNGTSVLDSTSSVSVAFTGTGASGGAVSGAYVDCGAGSADDGVWTCPTGGYFTAVTGVTIQVAAVAG